MDFLNLDDPTNPAGQKGSENGIQNTDGFTLGGGEDNFLDEGGNSGIMHRDTFPLIDESALNLDFGPNDNSQSQPTGSSSVQQNTQQPSQQQQQQQQQQNINPNIPLQQQQTNQNMISRGMPQNMPLSGNVALAFQSGASMQVPGEGSFQNQQHGAQMHSGQSNQANPRNETARKALMAKFMSLTPEQRRRFIERQRQYRQMVMQQRVAQQQAGGSKQATSPTGSTQGTNFQQLNQSQMNQQQRQQMFLQLQQQQQRQQQQQQEQEQQRRKSSAASVSSAHISHAGSPPQFAPGQNATTPGSISSPQAFTTGHSRSQSQPPASQHQFGPQNVQKFLVILSEFMAKRGTPLPQKIPVIGGRQLNLFLMYFMVSKLGGFVHVLKTGKIQFIAGKLGIDPKNRQLLSEFVQLYHKTLFPFEQFASTPDGMRQLAVRRQQLQNQGGGTTSTSVPNTTTNTPGNTSTPGNVNTPGSINTPRTAISTPKPNVKSRPNMSSEEQNQASQQQRKRSQDSGKKAKTKTAKKSKTARASTPHGLHGHHRVPDFVRNYVPHNRLLDKTAGFNLEALESYGSQVDHLKPVFLYFPELGKVSIHALTMALASKLDAEINVALNVLLIVTSDPSFALPLDDCKELLDNLCYLGEDIVDSLCKGDVNRRQREVQEVVAASEYNNNDDGKDPGSIIENTFAKYKQMFDDSLGKATVKEITVDSFTGEELNAEFKDGEGDTIDVKLFGTDGLFDADIKEGQASEGKFNTKSSTTSGSSSDVDSENPNENKETFSKLGDDSEDSSDNVAFSLPSYIDLLHQCRSEAEDFERGVHTKSYQNRPLMLIEELSTLSMILRNMSFINGGRVCFNNLYMATCNHFLDYLFAMIESIGTHPDVFLLSRKRLCLMKDILIVFANISHALDLRNEREFVLIMALCFSFCGQLTESDKTENFLTAKLDPVIDKYQLHSVDVLSKILCGSANNRHILKNVIGGEIQDVILERYLKKLIGTGNLNDGSLAKKLFSSMFSIIPLHLLHRGVEPFNSRLASCLEALLGCISLINTVQESEFTTNVALDILSSPEDIGNGAVHLSFIYAAIYVNTNFETKIQHAYISCKCSELVNVLIRTAIDYCKDSDSLEAELGRLSHLQGLFANDNNMIGVLITPNIPPQIAAQVVESTKLMAELKKLCKDARQHEQIVIANE